MTAFGNLSSKSYADRSGDGCNAADDIDVEAAVLIFRVVEITCHRARVSDLRVAADLAGVRHFPD